MENRHSATIIFASAMPPELEQGLLGLPLVVFRMVLGFLHEDDPKTLYALRSVSRACRNESDALLFHTSKLQDHIYRHEGDILWEETYGDPEVWRLEDFKLHRAAKGLLQSMLDETSPIAGHIRHLQIGRLRQDVFDSIIAPALGKVLTCLTNLRSLSLLLVLIRTSWDTNIPIPENVLDVFHSAHPTARLHVTNTLRERKPMDRLLLSSPQLHSLEMSIYFDSVGVCPLVMGRSELQILKSCLMQGNSVKVLRLGLEDAEKNLWGKKIRSLGVENWEDGPLNFHWQDGDRFPALEEWAWTGLVQYVYSTQQLEMWRQCMDWTQLRVLDFGFMSLASLLPLELLAGHVPRLNCLTVVIITSDRRHGMDDPARSLLTFEAFLRSVPTLRKLCLGWELISNCLPIILHHQGHALHELELNYSNCPRAPWDSSECIDVLTKAPHLRFLRVQTNKGSNPVDLQGRWSGGAVSAEPAEKYLAMVDVTIEETARRQKKHAAVMERVRARGEVHQAVERTPQEIERVRQLARENPRGE
ncbi:hypothetical protein GMOD_00007406 [Pyrenophora seminiperda CCB06]|uniref:F-box domain-containing protein n=1 Tax=Pyrenophora seminiperda CCB06 TaxID=1302712 RepID=A0A3M7MDI1_9PLEO|nr:hypothetical protein GMOD_00007406 [Pyrenophora seminiperda CCB06]